MACTRNEQNVMQQAGDDDCSRTTMNKTITSMNKSYDKHIRIENQTGLQTQQTVQTTPTMQLNTRYKHTIMAHSATACAQKHTQT